jgi:hypothetical protein
MPKLYTHIGKFRNQPLLLQQITISQSVAVDSLIGFFSNYMYFKQSRISERSFRGWYFVLAQNILIATPTEFEFRPNNFDQHKDRHWPQADETDYKNSWHLFAHLFVSDTADVFRYLTIWPTVTLNPSRASPVLTNQRACKIILELFSISFFQTTFFRFEKELRLFLVDRRPYGIWKSSALS